FYEVSFQLHQESENQLMRASKSQAMVIYERLELLNSDLQLLSAQVNDRRVPAIGRVLTDRLESVTVFDADGSSHSLWGPIRTLPELSSAERQHLLSGEALIQLASCTGDTDFCISMVRMTKSGSMVIGTPKAEFVWVPKYLPSGLQFCVLSASRIVLFCSEDEMSVHVSEWPAFDHASGLYQWRSGNSQSNAAFWKLLIGPMFLQEPWTVVVSQPRAASMAAMAQFRRSFPLVILLALWIVLFVSMVQVRRTLVPLERLQQGTQKIGAGEFNSRVEVNSGDEFEDLASSFNSMASQLGRQFHALKTINEIDQAIFASLDREAIVDAVLTRMPSLLPSAGFAVCVLDVARSSGWTRFRDMASGEVKTETTGLAGRDLFQMQGSPEVFTVAGDQRIPDYLLPLSRAGMRSFLVLPIRIEDSVRAALICAQRGAGALATEDVQEARQVADQLGVALSHVGLIHAFEQLHWGTLTALARAIDAKSDWTAGHSERVTEVAIQIARHMGLTPKDLRIMQMGGLLHDIGKIGTPPAILDKPGKLTDDEMRVMKDHVRTGVRILEPIPGFCEALPIVAEHHEWFNGKGYPEGLAGGEIALHARIFAVADCYDELTSDRPYRKGLPAEQTIAMLREKSGIQFDPEVIEAFTAMMAERLLKEKAAAAFGGVL
ncbi:MAG TPA: HD domain-containing phosphohydrolase, partial [Terriglobales bacterium]|nr:HD domain-containing phosphohydrolase [Terriglobales bacterium]